ncbi:MAG: hypothetical protein NTX22_11600 [Ignavibacteriales bacterium]|nr:hypothetical protein [Ignavibacteriales bacterium]
MRRILFIILLVSIVYIPAQENYKGKISLTFNDEKMDIPINNIMIRKESQIIVSIRAERNEDSVQQMISMELSLKNLSSDEKSGPNPYDMQLRIFKRKINEKHNPFTEEFGYDFEKERLYFRTENNDEKMSWEIKSFHIRMSDTKITFNDGSLIIKGSFSFDCFSEKSKKEILTVVEIKDFNYEIII